MGDFEQSVEHEKPASELEPTSTFLAVEEHAKRQGVAPSIFAAVIQSKGWAAGKKTTETVFEDAVNAFLGAPMGR
jgi:hypothetical protein